QRSAHRSADSGETLQIFDIQLRAVNAQFEWAGISKRPLIQTDIDIKCNPAPIICRRGGAILQCDMGLACFDVCANGLTVRAFDFERWRRKLTSDLRICRRTVNVSSERGHTA